MSSAAALAAMGLSAPPFVPAPRMYSGNMCGTRVLGLPSIPGRGGPDDLVASWFYDRYSLGWQAKIRSGWMPKYPDVLLSWPDSRAAGASALDFGVTCRTLGLQQYRPAVMLASKDYDPLGDRVNFDQAQLDGILANVRPVIPYLTNVAPRVGIAWESDLWLSPPTLHALIDELAPVFVAYGCKVYVHFSPGKGAWQENNHQTAYFWNAHIGQLTGLFHQRIPGSSAADYQYNASGCLADDLERFGGADGFSADSGFGHPWDLIALEITASEQFGSGMDEATGNSWGDIAMQTPVTNGLRVMGSGNGWTLPYAA